MEDQRHQRRPQHEARAAYHGNSSSQGQPIAHRAADRRRRSHRRTQIRRLVTKHWAVFLPGRALSCAEPSQVVHSRFTEKGYSAMSQDCHYTNAFGATCRPFVQYWPENLREGVLAKANNGSQHLFHDPTDQGSIRLGECPRGGQRRYPATSPMRPARYYRISGWLQYQK